MSNFTHVTIFDREYPLEVQAEGIAVSQAVATGACYQCEFFARCSTDDSFKIPLSAWCSNKKIEILAKLEKGKK